MSCSESEEDYMSNRFLTTLTDVKPGVSSSRQARRILRISSTREACIEHGLKASSKYKSELERIKLDEGLNRPICQESKGFKLLSMMGYKPGMSIGVKRDGGPEGIKEPIRIGLKSGRSGIGTTDIFEKRRLDDSERDKAQNILSSDFVKRRRVQAEHRQAISDICSLRKTCHELDSRIGLELPKESWFWPIYIKDSESSDQIHFPAAKKRALMNEFDEKTHQGDNQSPVEYFYGNGKIAPPDENFGSMDGPQLFNLASRLVDYMRTVHLYCLWCGCLFKSKRELLCSCPGTTRPDHT